MARSPRSSAPSRLRWLAAPALAAALVGVATVGPSLAGADPRPSLPPISAQDLIVKVHQASVPGLSGTVSSSPSLGLPDLGSLLPEGAGPFLGLLTSPQQAKVWVAGTDVRVALPSSLAESDVIRRGDDVWVWQSSGQQVRHLRLGPTEGPADNEHPADVAPTPQAMAQKLLDAADPTTRVFVRDTATVAGRPAYELVLAPRSSTTLVSDVIVAVDAATGLPLRVQVLARDSGTPALDLGFSSVDFSVPASSTFAFSPPPGSTVTEVSSVEELLMPAGDGPRVRHGTPGPEGPAPAPTATPGSTPSGDEVTTIGDGWETVVVGRLPQAPPDSGGGASQLVDSLRRLGQPVSGPWGSGRLVHTNLVNVLLLDNGRFVAGAVTVDALEADAATVH